jgi:hypothetical protein
MRKITAILLLIALLLSLSACGMLVVPLLETIPTEQSSQPATTAPQPEIAPLSEPAGILARCSENLKAVSGASVHIALEAAADGMKETLSLDGEMMFFPFAMHLSMKLKQAIMDDTLDLYFRDAEEGAALYYCNSDSDSRFTLPAFTERVPIKEAGLGTAVGDLFQALFDPEAAWELEETEAAYVLRTVVDLSGKSSSLLRAESAAQLTQLSVGGLPAIPNAGEMKFGVAVEIDREQLLLQRVSLDFTELFAEALKSAGEVEQVMLSVDFSDYNAIERVKRPTNWMDRPINGLSFETGKEDKADPDQVDELTVRVGEHSGEIRLSAVSIKDLEEIGWMGSGSIGGMEEIWKSRLQPYTSYSPDQTETVHTTAVLYSDYSGRSTSDNSESDKNVPPSTDWSFFDDMDDAPSTGVFLSGAKDLYAGTLDENVSFESPKGIRTGMTAEEAIQILGKPSGSFDEELFVCHAWANEKTALLLYFFPENGLFALSRSQITDMGALPFLRES